MAALAEWFDVNEIPAELLDLDTENKARGSLTHFFAGRVPKAHTPRLSWKPAAHPPRAEKSRSLDGI